MRAYEAGSAAYFATPPVNLIYAYHASLTQITRGAPSLEERFAAHRRASARIKDACAALGLRQLPRDPAYAANGMTAVYFPAGLAAPDVVPRLLQKDVVVAGGLHKDHKGACASLPACATGHGPVLTRTLRQTSISASGTSASAWRSWWGARALTPTGLLLQPHGHHRHARGARRHRPDRRGAAGDVRRGGSK